jgi:hypothetical protein
MAELPDNVKWVLKVPGMRQRLGLGDLVEQVAKKVGISPCAGCQGRKKLLNKVVLE